MSTELFDDQTPQDFSRRLQLLGNTFDSENSNAKEILDCDDLNDDSCPHLSCVAAYLHTGTTTYDPFEPAYGGGAGYLLGVSQLLQQNELWSGNEADRTDTSAAGDLEVLKYQQAGAEVIQETACEVSPDDIEIPLVCIDVPNPLKSGCEAIELILKLTGLVITTLDQQASFQDSLVDGAEVEASYENTRNLLHKQCAIFDQARCRCQEEDAAGKIGLGCGRFLHVGRPVE